MEVSAGGPQHGRHGSPGKGTPHLHRSLRDRDLTVLGKTSPNRYVGLHINRPRGAPSPPRPNRERREKPHEKKPMDSSNSPVIWNS